MSTKFIYPNTEPTLRADFANSKRIPPEFQYSRASTGTYVGSDGLFKTAQIGEPRFDHNPITGESLGLLVEEARTNLVTYSQAFNNTNYSTGYNGGGFTENATVAPDGTLTASKLTRNAGTSGAFWGKYNMQGISVTNGTAYTLSCFLKAAEITTVRLHGDVRDGGGTDFSAAFTLTGSGSYALYSATSAQISYAGNGWYRCSVTGTSTSTEGEEPALLVFGTGASGDGFFAWGFQLEVGSFPTSYIPTTSATVTRAADVASITGTNFSSWYTQTQGTFFVALRLINTGEGCVIGPTNSSNGDLSQGLLINAFTAQLRVINYLDSGSTSNDIVNNTPLIGVNKIAVAGSITDDTTGVYFNTSTGFVNASRAGGFSDVAGLKIGERSGLRITGTIARLTYYPVRLPDATLQAITAPPQKFEMVMDSSLPSDGVCAIITSGTVTYTVDWGDETAIETVVATGTFTKTHAYSVPKEHVVKIAVTSGTFRPFYNNSVFATHIKQLRATPSGWSFGTSVSVAWYGGTNITFIDSALNTSIVTDFTNAWRTCSSLTRFPLINTTAGTNFQEAWYNCSSLTSFPANMFDTCTATNFTNAWANCALTAQSIENIIVSINTANTSNGTLTLSGGTNAGATTWTANAVTAYNALIARGWTITFNA